MTCTSLSLPTPIFDQLFRVPRPVPSYTYPDFGNVLKRLNEHISRHLAFRLPLVVVAALIFRQRKSLETDVFDQPSLTRTRYSQPSIQRQETSHQLKVHKIPSAALL